MEKEGEEMKRLTVRIDGSAHCMGRYQNKHCNIKRCGCCKINDEIIKKLADYEDTGMTPGQVIEMQMDWVAMKAASETYRKEKAERPDIYGDGYDPDGNMIYDAWDCPRCGTSYEIDYDHYDYCPNCGQKIDWSSEDEK